MGFFEGLEDDIRQGERPFLLRALIWVFGLVERLKALFGRRSA